MYYFTVCILAVILMVVFFFEYRLERERIELDKLELYNSINFKEKYKIISDIIDEEMADFELKNIAYDDDAYVNEEKIKLMINTVTTKVFQRITPAIRYNFNLIYNVSEDNDMILKIGEIVSIKVLDYATEQNQVVEEL